VDGRSVVAVIAEGRTGRTIDFEAPQRMLEKSDNRGACIVRYLTFVLPSKDCVAELSK